MIDRLQQPRGLLPGECMSWLEQAKSWLGSSASDHPADRFIGIQVLRGLAAPLVIVVHISTEVAYGMGWAGIIPSFISLGALADLFFVISGFVVVYAAEPLFGRPGAGRVFFLRRLARIVPLYWATSAFILVFILLFYGNLEVVIHSIGSIVASFAMVPYPRPNGVTFPLNPPGWTLPYEMFFYATFAVALVLSRIRAVLALTALFLVLVAVGWMVKLPQPLQGWCDPLIIEFCFGMMIALAYRAGWRVPFWAACFLVLCAAGSFAVTAISGPHIPLRVLIWGVPAAFVVAAVALSDFKPAPGRLIRAIAFVGDASFSIYLMHALAITVPRRFLTPVMAVPQMPWTFLILLTVFATIVGIVTYLVFERPLTRALHRRIGAPHAPTMQPAVPLAGQR